MFLSLSGGMEDDLAELRESIVDEVKDGYWITLAGQMPEYVKLDEKPSENSMADTDGDSLTDWEELSGIVQQNNFDPNKFLYALNDSFNDFLSPFPVYNYSSHPGKADTDNDGIEDWEEVLIGTEPKNRDTDGDELGDGYEYVIWFDPLSANPDGDSYPDGEELLRGQNPYVYDLSPIDQTLHFIGGYFGGDIIQDPTAPQLYGQILSGVTPVVGDVADVRDVIANAAHGEWEMTLHRNCCEAGERGTNRIGNLSKCAKAYI